MMVVVVAGLGVVDDGLAAGQLILAPRSRCSLERYLVL